MQIALSVTLADKGLDAARYTIVDCNDDVEYVDDDGVCRYADIPGQRQEQFVEDYEYDSGRKFGQEGRKSRTCDFAN